MTRNPTHTEIVVSGAGFRAPRRVCDPVAARRKQIPESIRAFYDRAVSGDGSPRNAIKAMCQMCMGWEDWRAAIRDCTDPACPLYQYRPYQVKEIQS